MIIYTLSDIKDQLIGLPESPERSKYELDLLTWQLKHGKRKQKIIGMGIQNKEGLQLMSSSLIRPEQITTQEFSDTDVLAVKVQTDLSPETVLGELKKSFSGDVVEHPTKKGFVILNWNKHYNTTFV